MKIAPLQSGSIEATRAAFSPGGDPIYVLKETDAIAESEICLSHSEAVDLHEWLGRALSESEKQP